MKVHFSAPLRDIQSHLNTYNTIVSIIEANGHVLIKDWLKEYNNPKSSRHDFSEEEWEDITSKTLSAIMEADVVILDATVPSFSMGYEAAMALSQKKPLLVLFGEPQYYIMDPNSSLKRVEIYQTPEELEQAVASFLAENDTDIKNLRFNMVLDREVYNFLRWESINTGKTKAQIIREVLRDVIRRRR